MYFVRSTGPSPTPASSPAKSPAAGSAAAKPSSSSNEGAESTGDRATSPARAEAQEREKVRDAVAQRAAADAPADATLDLEFADAEGNPLAKRRYKVVDAKEKVFEGALDDQGRAHLTGLSPGSALVRLVDVPRTFESWEVLSGPQAQTPSSAGNAWLELVIADDEGRPVADRRFVVTDAKGARHEGTLDGKGRARVEKLPPGEAKVTFPA